MRTGTNYLVCFFFNDFIRESTTRGNGRQRKREKDLMILSFHGCGYRKKCQGRDTEEQKDT